jgi:hypothetical protein
MDEPEAPLDAKNAGKPSHCQPAPLETHFTIMASYIFRISIENPPPPTNPIQQDRL